MSEPNGDDEDRKLPTEPEKPVWEQPAIEPFEPAEPPLETYDEPGFDHDPLPPQRPAVASTIQVSTPQGWPPAAVPTPLGKPPLPDIEPIKPPRKRRGWAARIGIWAAKGIGGFVLVSVLMVVIFRFVPPPVTWTMIGDIFAGNGVTKDWMSLDEISPNMARAAIAAEDARFCQHGGFDYRAIAAAAARNATGKKTIRGGSTISQQTAKNVFLWQGGGYFRKGLEAYFTVLIENIWGKRRIMEVYLNVAETGIGTYGVNAGSQRYFKHDASKLTPREAAQIAAVLPLPKKRAGIDPKGFTRRYGNSITARIGVVRGDGLDACLK
jgi:monofunctional biosynthetic peptidoglycan transglycosylase